MGRKMSFCWNRFLIEGEELFEYMTHNFNDMFDKDSRIKHFNIRYEAIYDVGSQELKEKYGAEIQNELVPWIKKELEDNRLFDKTLWKPFRDIYSLSTMYLGYRKIFVFRPNYNNSEILENNNELPPALNMRGTYYFQLSLEQDCDEDLCKECNLDNTKIFNKHFEIIIHNWIDDKTNELYYNRRSYVLSDFLMSENEWDVM